MNIAGDSEVSCESAGDDVGREVGTGDAFKPVVREGDDEVELLFPEVVAVVESEEVTEGGRGGVAAGLFGREACFAERAVVDADRDGAFEREAVAAAVDAGGVGVEVGSDRGAAPEAARGDRRSQLVEAGLTPSAFEMRC